MVYLDNTTEEQVVYIPREGFLAGAHSGGERYYPGDNISISPSNVISVTGMTEAISAATSDFVTSGDVHSQIEEETSDFVTSGTVETMISTATENLASETYVDNAVSGKASTQYVDNAVSGKADTTAVTEALSSYTPTSGFATINGSAITEGGNIEIQGGGDSTALEEITELPENPVDGAVYNYNGLLIKYVNGAGNWGYWDGISVTKQYDRAMKNSATLFYGVIPASMEGELAFGLGYITADPANTKLWAYFNLSGDTIDIYDNSGKTGSTLYSIQRNAGSQTQINNSSILAYISWDDGVIQINFDSHYDQLLKYCDTSISTAHYELEQSIQRKYTISRDLSEPGYYGQPPYYLSQFDTKSGVAYPGIQLSRGTIYINNSGYSNQLTYWGNSAPIQRMFVPTASGETGSLLVSQGNAAPVFKTVSQALGVDFWVGTQDEYDAITTKSATTLYIIIPDNS